MITRVWHGRTAKQDAERYRVYLIRTGVQEYRRTPGNLGVEIWQKEEGEVSHIWTVSTWKDLDSIRQFAGPEVEKAKYYPEDKRYLLEMEPCVSHYRSEAFSAPDHAKPLLRITI